MACNFELKNIFFVKNFLCCIPLKLGGLILGGLSLFIGILLVILLGSVIAKKPTAVHNERSPTMEKVLDFRKFFKSLNTNL